MFASAFRCTSNVCVTAWDNFPINCQDTWIPPWMFGINPIVGEEQLGGEQERDDDANKCEHLSRVSYAKHDSTLQLTR
jgi:hypothetical protein